MDRDRFAEVERVCMAALELPADGRDAFVDETCGRDEDLRAEVRSLLGRASCASALFERQATNERPPALSPGQRLGPYEITGTIGSGGMGEVYKARDTRLDRTVAIKILPIELSGDLARRARLEREAKTIASLNHPHICVLHDVGREHEMSFLVMEYLEGQTLADRLAAGPLAVDEAVTIGRDIADALGAAHSQGIVHRDLKPGNVMLTPSGAKLLDFGLARATCASGDVGSATLSSVGQIVGTLPYMSPEQLQGSAVDARTDLFAFGVVLYEMLTGKRAFDGGSTAGTIAAILSRQPPPVSAAQPSTPPALDRLVSDCLGKEPGERRQSAIELKRALEKIHDDLARRRHAGLGRFLLRSAGLRRDHRLGRRRALVAIAALVLVAAAAAGLAYRFARRTPPLTDRDLIVLADFENKTRDTVFDATLQQALTVQLAQSPFLAILGGDRLAGALQQMRKPPDTRLDRPTAREVCERAGGKAMLVGSIAPLGASYVVTLECIGCATGELIDSVQVTRRGQEQALEAVGSVATEMRKRLGETLASIQRYDVPIKQGTTASFEAWKAFSAGVAERDRRNDADALPLLERAVEIDPDFALAWAHLAAVRRTQGRTSDAVEATRRAFALRDRVPEQERYYISHRYYLMTGEVQKLIDVNTSWARTYPRNWMPHDNLGKALWQVGEPERAVGECREALRLEPGVVFTHDGVIGFDIQLGRFDEARAAAAALLATGISDATAHDHLARIAWLQHDRAALEREKAWLQSHATRLHAALLADMARSSGRLREAARLAPLTPDVLAFVGKVDEARKATDDRLRAWLATNPGPSRPSLPPPSVFLGAALAGDTGSVETAAQGLATMFPNSTLPNEVGLRCLRAALELSRGNGVGAVEALEPARRYGFGWDSGFTPAYLRGLGYLQARQPNEAAAEFETIIGYPGVLPGKVIWPLAHLGRARALSLTGDLAASRAAYERFLALWAEADEDLPVLQEARQEFEKLRTRAPGNQRGPARAPRNRPRAGRGAR